MSKRKKVCFFNGFFPICSGGAEYQAYLLAKSLDPRKYDVFFISIEENWDGEHYINGLRVYFLKSMKTLRKFGKPFFLYYKRINAILEKERPDIVYQRTGNAVTAILEYLSSKYSFRFFWACASEADLRRFTLSPPRRILNNIDNLLRIYGLQKANTILAQSAEQQKMFLERFRRQAIILPNAHPIPHEEISKEATPLQVIWIGAFKPLKRPEIFARLASEFSGNPDVKFIMVGRSKNCRGQSRLQNNIDKHTNLVSTGQQPQQRVNEILSRGHVFVNTSTHEGFPNTFIQAWLRRVPVVSLDVDPDHVLIRNQIGFRSGSFQNLCKDVNRLLKDKSLRETMGTRAQKYARKNHSLEMVSKRFNHLINLPAAK